MEPTPEKEKALEALGNAEDLDPRLVKFLEALPLREGQPAPIVDQEMARMGPVPTDYREAVILSAAVLLQTRSAPAAFECAKEYLRQSVSLSHFMTRFMVIALASETVHAAVEIAAARSEAFCASLSSATETEAAKSLPRGERTIFVEQPVDPIELKKFQIALVRNGFQAMGA